MKCILLNSKVLLVLLSLGLGAGGVQARNSEEATTQLVESAIYNPISGHWDVRQRGSARRIADDFKKLLPRLDYFLVNEAINGTGRFVLTFRGKGDQRVIVKFKEFGSDTNVRIRVGRFGSESKSRALFAYVFKNN